MLPPCFEKGYERLTGKSCFSNRSIGKRAFSGCNSVRFESPKSVRASTYSFFIRQKKPPVISRRLLLPLFLPRLRSLDGSSPSGGGPIRGQITNCQRAPPPPVNTTTAAITTGIPGNPPGGGFSRPAPFGERWFRCMRSAASSLQGLWSALLYRKARWFLPQPAPTIRLLRIVSINRPKFASCCAGLIKIGRP